MKGANRKSLEPWILDSVEYYQHQVDGVRDLANRSSFLLADQMGCGKSLSAITVFAVDIIRGWAKSCIIVCPVTLKQNWYDEFNKFTRIPATVLNGTPAQRRILLSEFANQEDPKVLIVNYEQVTSHLEDLNKLHFSIRIFDECHFLKNHKAKRTKAAIDLKAERTFMLSGTPMLNQVNELWTVLHMIDPVKWPKYWSFVNRHAVFGGFQARQIVGVKNERELIESLQSVMLRRLKKDVLDLPEVQIIERKIELLPEQRKLYDEVISDMRLPSVGQASPMDIENALTKFLRLKQICGTTQPFLGVDISSKLDLAVDDAVELLKNGNKIVVFTQFRSVLEQFCIRLDKEAGQFDIYELHGDIKQDQRQPTVKEWVRSTTAASLVCMLQVAGVGLNMTASSHALFLDKLFVPGLNQQAIDRLHRIGTDKSQPVQVLEYICTKTIENRVNQILTSKKKLFDNVVESDPTWRKKLYQALIENEN